MESATRFDLAARAADFISMYLDQSPTSHNPSILLEWATEVLHDLIDLEKKFKDRGDRKPIGCPAPIHSALAEWEEKHRDFFEHHRELVNNLPEITEAVKTLHDDLSLLRDLARSYNRLYKRIQVITKGVIRNREDDEEDEDK